MPEKRRNKPTIKDVAREAGVSVATVSRVLNESGYFDPETQQRVKQAIVSLGYRRNIHWTRLKRKSAGTVCFLLGNRGAMNSMQMRMLVACETVMRSAGIDVVFTGFHYSPETRSANLELPRMLAEDGIVDGVILAGQHHANLLAAFEEMGLPYVLMASNFTGGPSAIEYNALAYDDWAGCYEAAGYLVRLGHKRIAAAGNLAKPWFRRRLEGFRAGLAQHRVTLTAVTGDWQVPAIEYGRLAVAELLRQPKPPTAIFAANDELAAGVWKELIHRGLRIPRDISLAGFGDREEFQILEPSLTTVSVFPDRLGAELAKMLLHRLEEPGVRLEKRVFPCQLMERASCGPPPSTLAVVAR